MKKQIYHTLLLVSLCFATVGAQAQEEADSVKLWNTTKSVGLNFTNVGLENWAGGGVSSVALGFIGQMKAIREGENSIWTNQIDLAYGLQKQDGNETFRKTDDQLILSSQYGYKFSKEWLVSGELNFRTQMDNGYKYGRDDLDNETRDIISRIMAPGYLTLNVGITFKKKKWLSMTFSPLTNKNTFVLDDDLSAAGAFGVTAGSKVRSEFGASLGGNISTKIMENVNFSTSFTMFSNYEDVSTIDVNWETLISMKVNSYLNASFGTQLIYDEDVDVERNDGTLGAAVQFKHVLSIGLGFTF